MSANHDSPQTVQQPLFTEKERIDAICNDCSSYKGNDICGSNQHPITVSISGRLLRCPEGKWWSL